MPTFDATCEGCGNPFEAIAHDARRLPACPQCGSSNVTRRWTFRGDVSRTQFPTRGESFLAHRHAQDIERAAANGTLQSLRISGRDPGVKPSIPRRIY